MQERTAAGPSRPRGHPDPASPGPASPGTASPGTASGVGARRTGGRRYRAGRPHPAAPEDGTLTRPAAGWPGGQTAPFPAGVSAVGTLAELFAVCLACCLVAGWLHFEVLAGLGYCVGCGLAAWYARPSALLLVVISVPTVFLTAVLAAQLVAQRGGGHHGTLLPVLDGTLLTLTSAAPWLFAGTAGAVILAVPRGLAQRVRELRDGLSGRDSVRPAGPGDRLA